MICQVERFSEINLAFKLSEQITSRNELSGENEKMGFIHIYTII